MENIVMASVLVWSLVRHNIGESWRLPWTVDSLLANYNRSNPYSMNKTMQSIQVVS